ncbi:LysE/ArgO family amino acid transporter [Azohydromonas caseinilytica]|uniref:LysE family transporter n=1 Tax=Azohydromonas caseinilytica TaxID=2728836 RepID=A0A848F5A0_9BURK|nr:LysE family transporter [Azohydromonas caseinilytica]NML13875.1 LysE family transporter [Azohydromonas caseinilytica]
MSAASSVFFQGWLAMAGLIVAIGAQNAFVLRQGLLRAHVAPVVALCAASDAVLVFAGVFGLGQLLQGAPALMAPLRWAGAAYLLWFGVQAARRAWRADGALAVGGAAQSRTGVLLTTAALTWLNPHVYLDTVLLIGALGAQQAQPLAFASGAATASLMWFTALGVGAAALAPKLAQPRTWRCIDALVALAMAAVAWQLLSG